MRSADGDDHVLDAGVDAVFRLQLADNSGAQRIDAGGGRVAGAILDGGAQQRVLDGVRRFEERLAAVEGVDGLARRAQFQNLVADLHDVGEPDLIETFREMDSFAFGGHWTATADPDVSA